MTQPTPKKFCLAFLLLLLPGCPSTPPVADMAITCPTTPPTFGDVYAGVFKVSCQFSDCHNHSSHMGSLDLVVDPYHQLVNAKATQKEAATEGLVRVDPTSLEKSFLWIKVNDIPVGATDNKYGQRMPNVTDGTLDANQLALVQCWIQAGAKDDDDPYDSGMPAKPADMAVNSDGATGNADMAVIPADMATAVIPDGGTSN